MKPESFLVLKELAAIQTGQHIDETKSHLYALRLDRLFHGSADDLADGLKAQGAGSNLGAEIAAALLDPRSRFVSERGEFAALFEDVIRPGLARSCNARYRIWCAGCGTGQEAYSLLIMLRNRLSPEESSRIDITATDFSPGRLMTACRGVFSHFEVQVGLSSHNLLKCFTQLPEGDWQVIPDIRQAISFKRHNLLCPGDAPASFDLVICRDVLQRMTAAHAGLARDNLIRSLKPDGHLHVSPLSDCGSGRG